MLKDFREKNLSKLASSEEDCEEVGSMNYVLPKEE
jgi:hypothetical protein